MGVYVKNTFIDTALERTPSMEAFFQERMVSTCPASQVGRCRKAMQIGDSQLQKETFLVEGSGLKCTAGGSSSRGTSITRTSEADQAELLPRLPHATSVHSAPARLSDGTIVRPSLLAGIESIPQLLPSTGSAGHFGGDCQPCAFFHSGRCVNDLKCQFCHLCDDSERRRRKKAKEEMRRKSRREASAAAQAA